MTLHQKYGTYALILRSSGQRTITIGKLGELKMRKGYYVYVGSAFGPGGVRARVKRHCRISASPHWHINYLRSVVEIIEVWYTYDPERREHQWADILMGIDGVVLPLKDFGSSDCKCDSHLFFFTSPITVDKFRAWIQRTIPKHHRVEWIEGGSP